MHRFDSTRPLNSLKITGNFTVADAHQWLSLLVSEIPERAPSNDTVSYNFSSVFIGSELQAMYRSVWFKFRNYFPYCCCYYFLEFDNEQVDTSINPSTVQACLSFCLNIASENSINLILSFIGCAANILCQYFSRDSAIFRSDNVSTISIIRDVLSREVTRRQVKVDIQYGES